MVSILSMYNIDFPGGISNNNIKWRAVMWIMVEISLFLAVVPNYINSEFIFMMLVFTVYFCMFLLYKKLNLLCSWQRAGSKCYSNLCWVSWCWTSCCALCGFQLASTKHMDSELERKHYLQPVSDSEPSAPGYKGGENVF